MSHKIFVHEFPKKMFIATLNWLIAKLDTTGISRQTKRHGVGMPSSTSRTTENVYAVEAHVLSQEDRPGNHRTFPRISRETDISRRKWRHNF